MRTPDRDRCRSAVAALCIAIVIFILPVSALTAEYLVLPNGTAYFASVEVANVKSYDFIETGVLGERLPLKVTNVTITGNCTDCNYTRKGDSSIEFIQGNYTISYLGPIRDNHIHGSFDNQYNITVILPSSFSVTNPLLAGLSQGASVLVLDDNTTRIQWNKMASFDLRFYDANRESLLYLFGNFWLIIAVVLLLPFLLTMRKKQ